MLRKSRLCWTLPGSQRTQLVLIELQLTFQCSHALQHRTFISMVEHDYQLRHRHHQALEEGSNTPRTHPLQHSSSSQHAGQHQHCIQTEEQHEQQPIATACSGSRGLNSGRRPPLQTSLRWLQLCLLLLFAQDVFCFSLGYPFLPQYLEEHGHGGPGAALAFGIYGLASIATLLLLLLIQSSRRESSGILQQPAAKYWLIVVSTSLAAAAGAFNTLVPDSYAVLLAAKAAQGAASALYFVSALGLIALVFPADYKTQAMAVVSAGLMLGDALGPVAGGIVYQAKGLQPALGMQPAVSGLALLALLLLVLVWPNRKRPWGIAHHHHLQQQQHSHLVQHKQQRQCPQHDEPKDVEHAVQDLTVPLLQEEPAGPPMSSVPFGSTCGAECTARSIGATCNISRRAALTTAAAAAASKFAQSSPLPLLLSNQGVLLMCMLALMCQAARTAIDLLLPMMLQDSVQPGLIGLLFAGEAVGSVVTPFCVDWFLHRQSRHSSDGKQMQHKQADSNHAVVGPARDEGPTAVVDNLIDDRQAAALLASNCNAAECCKQQPQQCVTANDDADSASRAALTANRLLCCSAVGMALCCCVVLSAWELPAVGCSMLQASHGSSSMASAEWRVPMWLCSYAETADVASTNAPGAAVDNGTSSSSNTFGWDSMLPHHHKTVEAGLLLAFRGSSSPWPVVSIGTTGSTLEGSTMVAAGVGDVIIGAATESDAATAARGIASACVAFCLLQLLLTGLLLMVLGGCHSSCEALIYTVLTDLVTASRQAHSGCISQMQKTGVGSKDSSLEVGAWVQTCGQGDVHDCSKFQQGACGHVHDSCGSFNADAAGCNSELCVSSDSDAADDATEVVMVLYVLFWVVGFTVGAAVAGIPGSSLVGQQLTGCVTGLVLGISAWWSWRKAADAFRQSFALR